ncbi:MAG: FISUMP domain-containing protein, partial [Melioribacteraceae bacterium]
GNGAGNNSSGFSALLTGEFFYNDGNYFSKGFSAFIWSTNENGRDATAMDLDFGNNFISLFTTDKRYGYSVRCLKD